MSDYKIIKQDISIYEGIEQAVLVDDAQSWETTLSDVFEEVVALTKPTKIIENGSWKGGSAIRWAKLAPEATIWCVDTWLGSLEMFAKENRNYAIPFHRGYPAVYYVFLKNVKKAGVEKQIVPVPATSSTGAAMLKHDGITADLIFIDASHQMRDAYYDFVDYWPLLRTGGIMLVDDVQGFIQVHCALMRFCIEIGVQPVLSKDGKLAYLVKL